MVRLLLPILLVSAGALAEDELPATQDFSLDFDVSSAGIEVPPAAASGTAWASPRWGFAWQLGANLDALDTVNSHRLDSRLRWEQLLLPWLYASVDGKLIIRATGDQQLRESEDAAWDWRVRELSLQASDERVGAKLGFQTIVWGEMDTAPINDLLSPWDYSEYAYTAPEDARIGQAALTANYFVAGSTVTIAVVPWALTNRYPGGDTNGLVAAILGVDNANVKDNQPEAMTDMEYGLRLKYSFPGTDVALYALSVLSNDPQFTTDDGVNFETRYSRYKNYGASINYVRDNILWKAELGYKPDVYIPAATPLERDTLEYALGADYNANGVYDLTLEAFNQHIFSGAGRLVGMKRDNSQIAGRISKNFLHDTLSVVYFLRYQVQYRDVTQSFSIDYAVNDYWNTSVNVTHIEINNQDSPYRFTDDWDQLSLRVSLDF